VLAKYTTTKSICGIKPIFRIGWTTKSICGIKPIFRIDFSNRYDLYDAKNERFIVSVVTDRHKKWVFENKIKKLSSPELGPSGPDPGPTDTPNVTVAVLEEGRRRVQIAHRRWVAAGGGRRQGRTCATAGCASTSRMEGAAPPPSHAWPPSPRRLGPPWS
jgi:hypothetical protein